MNAEDGGEHEGLNGQNVRRESLKEKYNSTIFSDRKSVV